MDSYENINLNQRSRYVFFQYLKKNFAFYGLGVFLVLLTSLTEAAVPWLIGLVSDLLVSGNREINVFGYATGLDQLCSAMLASCVLGLVGRIGWRQTLGRQTHVAGYDIKVHFWKSLKDLPIERFNRYSVGDLLNRATGDWNNVRFIHGFTMVLTFDMIFFAALAITLMSVIDWQLTLLSLAVIVFLPPLMKKVIRREVELYKASQTQLSHLSDVIQSSLETVRVQRAMAADVIWRKKLYEQSDKYRTLRKKMTFTSLLIFPLGMLPNVISYIVLLSLGVSRVFEGRMTVGQFIAFEAYILMIRVPLFELGDCIAEWQYGIASFKRVFEIFKLPFAEGNQVTKASLETPMSCDLDIKGLSFKYGQADKPVLDQLSLHVPGGSQVGILGPIGTGKSTLLRIISGVLSYDSGLVRCGQVDINLLSQAQITSLMAFVSQEVFLFSGTIRENLCLDQEFADQELLDVLRDVCLYDDFVLRKNGLETVIGEKGISLSGGQRQRLSIARAVLRKKRIYLFDDCLSAVDSVTETKIIANLDRRLQGSTKIWVAHRVSTLEKCSVIYSLEKGGLLPLEHSSGVQG